MTTETQETVSDDPAADAHARLYGEPTLLRAIGDAALENEIMASRLTREGAPDYRVRYYTARAQLLRDHIAVLAACAP